MLTNCQNGITNDCHKLPDGQYCYMICGDYSDNYFWMAKKEGTILYIHVRDEPFMTLCMFIEKGGIRAEFHLSARHRTYDGVTMNILKNINQINPLYYTLCKLSSEKTGHNVTVPLIKNKNLPQTINYELVNEFLNIFTKYVIHHIFIEFSVIKEILFREVSQEMPRWFESQALTDSMNKYFIFQKN